MVAYYWFCNQLTCFAIFFVFFFQAEDGIRDTSVTGVQTCALPISIDRDGEYRGTFTPDQPGIYTVRVTATLPSSVAAGDTRSEERRVGKECRSRGSPDHSKKKKERIKK